MDQSAKLLNCVAQTAQMGQTSIDRLLEKNSDEAFRAELLQQRSDYQTYRQDAETRLNAMGVMPEPKRALDRAGAWLGLEMSTLTDRSTAHLADLMVQGTTMGIIEVTKARNECTEADAQAQGVASAFIARQQQAVDVLKGFLC